MYGTQLIECSFHPVGDTSYELADGVSGGRLHYRRAWEEGETGARAMEVAFRAPQVLLLLLLSTCIAIFLVDAGSVGVNYGRVANNLPSAQQAVQLLQSTSITKVKLFDADSSVLRAFSGTPFEVIIGFPNEQIRRAATKQSFAFNWVKRNVVPFARSTRISAIAVGNEVINSSQGLATQLLPAMKSLHTALVYYKLDQQVKLSSPMALSVMSQSYPPSAGAFKPDIASAVLHPLLDFLAQTGSHVMVNAYPFFAYESNPGVISLDYALFRPNPGVKDPQTGLLYTNLFDAQLDAVFAAMSALGHHEMNIVVSETGWPNNGDPSEIGATASNAATYNGNLVKQMSSNAGTPMRPNARVDAFIFALFNENLKPGPGSERNYGLFYPDQRKVYDCGLGKNGFQGQSGPPVHHSHHSGSSSSSNNTGTGTKQQKYWCVAKSSASQSSIQTALDYACGAGKADCSPIQSGRACFLPNTLQAHASYAFNSYYQKNAKAGGTCDFAGAATLTQNNPSYGGCAFPLP